MSRLASGATAIGMGIDLADDAQLSRLEARLPPLLSVIAEWSTCMPCFLSCKSRSVSVRVG
jgi:hypothetical protein